MKKLCNLLFLFAFLSTSLCYSQDKIAYDYDMAGNRISRRIIELDSIQQVKQKPKADSTIVQDQLNFKEIRIYPNPTPGILRIDISGEDNKENFQLQLINGNGIVLISQDAIIGSNELNLSTYAKGWYILRVISGDNRKEYKIIKK